jgi:hypothetical protein
MGKYSQLILDWNKDLNRTRSANNVKAITDDSEYLRRLEQSTKKLLE